MAAPFNHLDIKEMWGYTLSINTDPAEGVGKEVWAVLGAGIDNLQEALNETVQQYHFFPDQGYGRSRVTAMAPVITLTGRRVVGDAAQDYIFGKKWGFGADRETQGKLVDPEGNTLEFDCTFANLQEINGATEEDSAITIEIHIDGAPVYTAASGG